MDVCCKEKKTLTFSEENGLSMDVYYPCEPRGDRACALSLHGGGFFEGSKTDEEQLALAQNLLAEGFIVCCMDYRLGLRGLKTGNTPPRGS